MSGGKIITKLMQKTFPMDEIEAGSSKLPPLASSTFHREQNKIIYMQRNLDEILYLMEKMAQITDLQREDTRLSFKRLQESLQRTPKKGRCANLDSG